MQCSRVRGLVAVWSQGAPSLSGLSVVRVRARLMYNICRLSRVVVCPVVSACAVCRVRVATCVRTMISLLVLCTTHVIHNNRTLHATCHICVWICCATHRCRCRACRLRALWPVPAPAPCQCASGRRAPCAGRCAARRALHSTCTPAAARGWGGERLFKVHACNYAFCMALCDGRIVYYFLFRGTPSDAPPPSR